MSEHIETCRDCGERFETRTDAERCPFCSSLAQGDVEQALLYALAYPASVRRPGKFQGAEDPRVAEALYWWSLDGVDCEGYDEVGDWYGVIGRFVVSEDGEGFFWYSREDSPEVAAALVGSLDGVARC